MVYGTTLRLPGMSFASPSNQPDVVDTTNYVQSLKSAMLNLQPTPPRPVNNPSFCVDPSLYSQSHVFIRQDSVRKPSATIQWSLQSDSRTKKHFTIDVNGRQEIVSVNRLNLPSLLLHLPLLHYLHLLLPSHLLPKLLDQVVVYTFLTVSHIKA